MCHICLRTCMAKPEVSRCVMSPSRCGTDNNSALSCVEMSRLKDFSRKTTATDEKHFEGDQESPRRWAPCSLDRSLPKAVSGCADSVADMLHCSAASLKLIFSEASAVQIVYP